MHLMHLMHLRCNPKGVASKMHKQPVHAPYAFVLFCAFLCFSPRGCFPMLLPEAKARVAFASGLHRRCTRCTRCMRPQRGGKAQKSMGAYISYAYAKHDNRFLKSMHLAVCLQPKIYNPVKTQLLPLLA